MEGHVIQKQEAWIGQIPAPLLADCSKNNQCVFGHIYICNIRENIPHSVKAAVCFIEMLNGPSHVSSCLLVASPAGGDVICGWMFAAAPQDSGLAQQGPETPPHPPNVALEADDGDKPVSQWSDSRCCWEFPGLDTQGCVCFHQQGEPHGSGASCWPGCPYAYGGGDSSLL